MKCPKCNMEMEFEVIKNFPGDWYCGECNIEINGDMIPIADGDGQLEYEERVYNG